MGKLIIANVKNSNFAMTELRGRVSERVHFFSLDEMWDWKLHGWLYVRWHCRCSVGSVRDSCWRSIRISDT